MRCHMETVIILYHFLSESTSILSGFTSLSAQSDELVVTATKPHLIELPRSRINVVVYWNIRMHNWLKIYIFNTSKRWGNFLAIIFTYSVS